MNLSIIGKASKVGTAIFNSHLHRNHQMAEYSMRSLNEIQNSTQNMDAVIYLIADTNTKQKDYVESLYTNCFLLAKFLHINKACIANKPFIYLSSAKIYELFPYSTKHAEGSLSEIAWFSSLHNAAVEIINISRERCDPGEIRRCLQAVLNQLTAELKLNGELPIYSFGKIIGEIIVESLVKNHFILRVTYLYGYQENRNIIYSLVENLFNHQSVLISSKKRDFVTYNTLVDIIDSLINENNFDKGRIFNVSSCDVVDGFRLSESASSLFGINHINPNLQFRFENALDFYSVDNSYLTHQLGKINKYHVETFDEGYSQIVYRHYIENICEERICDEFIGGSFARVYSARNNQGKKHVYKVCLGNGADNGNAKIINEAQQLSAVKTHLVNTKIDVVIPCAQIISETQNFSCVRQEYISGMNYIELFKHKSSDLSLKCLEKYCEKTLDIYASQLSKAVTTNIIASNKERVVSRLRAVNKANSCVFTDFQIFNSISINGIPYENPIKIINAMSEHERQFDSTVGLCISGDSILDNFILRNDEIAFIDARGENLIWEDGLPLFDPYYDLAKMYFYFYGWRQIRDEEFTLVTNNYSLKDCECTFTFIGEFAKKYEEYCDECMKIFIAQKNKLWMQEDENIFKNKILLLAGMHFLSDTYPRIVGKGKHVLDQCFLEFILGTKLINESARNLQCLFKNSYANL